MGGDLLRKVYTYCNESGALPVIDFINLAGKKFMKKFDFVLKYIQNEKECLCEPYVKHFSIEKYHALYELRLRINGTMIRVIFFLSDKGEILLLHAFFKRDRRDTEKALEYALKILNLIDTENIDNNERITEVIIK